MIAGYLAGWLTDTIAAEFEIQHHATATGFYWTFPTGGRGIATPPGTTFGAIEMAACHLDQASNCDCKVLRDTLHLSL
ncbi:MAG: hypothetical protein JWM11_6503 [Planctomycetaceae bacterium]|nr:hypothetical protein [Planctomycetaceae bacterium]